MRKMNYMIIIKEKFKTNRTNLTEKNLKNILNRKYFKYIIAQKKSF